MDTNERRRFIGVYPPARRSEQVDDFFGVKVSDPYRWLENANSKDPILKQEVDDFVAAQNELTDSYLADIPATDVVRRRLLQIMDRHNFEFPSIRGRKEFFEFASPAQNHSGTYVLDKPGARPRLILPGKSEDDTAFVNSTHVSWDGRLIAYSMSYDGSDWDEWHVRNVDTGQDLGDVVRWSKFSGVCWLPDCSGFVYGRYDEPAKGARDAALRNHKLYLHKLGRPQSMDTLVYHRPDQPDWIFNPFCADERYMVIQLWQSGIVGNGFLVKDMTMLDKMVELLPVGLGKHDFVHSEGGRFWFVTDDGAPKRRLVQVNVRLGAAEMIEIIPESDHLLQSVSLVSDRFVLKYLKDGYSVLVEAMLDGTIIGEMPVPCGGTIDSVRGVRGRRMLFSFKNFLHPPTVFNYDLDTKKVESHFIESPPTFDRSKYVTERVFCTSKDGTRVPMFVSYKKGLKRDGNNHCFLYGYGGFNTQLQPDYTSFGILWMEMGGVYAAACLRGGGEDGSDHYLTGTKLQKQNTFDDFIAAAESLIANGFTRPRKLCISGNSNGGLLVAACYLQRPDLFGAAIASVGVFDMLRFHLFTIGKSYCRDYGSPDIEAESRALFGYSPVHNVRFGVSHPAILIWTGTGDDRVVPGPHSYKFLATLQYCQGGDAPCLMRVVPNEGHSRNKVISRVIDEAVQKTAFLIKVLDIPEENWRHLIAA
jgi:prolyl oligopeptidase